MTEKITAKKLEEALETYAGLIEAYPDNEAYLQRYADMLQTMGRKATAITILQHLHDVISKRSESEAKAFAKQHPAIGRVNFDTVDKHLITGQIIYELLGSLWLRLHRKKLTEGQVLYKAGEDSDSIVLVLDGKLDVYATSHKQERVLLESIGIHDIIGEQMFLKPGKCNFDAFVASETATIVKIPRKKMLEFVNDNNNLKTMLLQRASFRAYFRFISSSSVFQILPIKLRMYITRNLVMNQYQSGSIIHAANQAINGIDSIASGEACYVASSKGGDDIMLPPLPVTSLTGDIRLQGEDTAGLAKLVAKSNVTVAHIPFHELLNVAVAFPPLKERLLQHAEAQQMHMMQTLTQTNKHD